MKLPSLLAKKIQLSLVAGAATLLFAAPAAHAAVISVSFAGAPVVIANNIDGTYFNFVTGVHVNAGNLAGYDFNPYNNNAGLTFYGAASPSGIMATGTPGTTATALALAFGASISAAGQFNQYQTVGTAFYRTGQEYVGLRFLNEVTGVINYGWVLLSTTAGNGFAASVLGYGYENTGAAITAGQTAAVTAVPEPGTTAMLGLGLVGLVAASARRRRKQA